jgi:hypothetical protein
MASILFLVLGDMTAAIIGVSFGGDALGQLKLGREGKKSLEGTAHTRQTPPVRATRESTALPPLDGEHRPTNTQPSRWSDARV